MRVIRYWPLFVIFTIAFSFIAKYWIENPVQVYALGASDVEIELLITDAETEKEIPDAALKIRVLDVSEVENKVGLSVLTANTVGLVHTPSGQRP
jgi:hypothetical protein